MPVEGIAPRYRELGRLKFGEDLGDRPGQLTTWRLTSPNPELIEAAALLYGGTVHHTDKGAEVVTESSHLDVLLPAQDVTAGQWYELWGAGGLKRRCTGSHIVDVAHDGAWTELAACACDPDRRECKLRTVLRVILPGLPDLGVWRLSTGSGYAAAELPPAAEAILGLSGGNLAPAILGLEKRQTKKQGQQVNHYIVPTLATRTTLADLLTAQIEPWDPDQIATTAPESPQIATEPVRGVLDSPKPLSEPPESVTEWHSLAEFLHEATVPGGYHDGVALLDELERRMIAVRLWRPGALDAAAAKADLNPSWRETGLGSKLRQFATRALLKATSELHEHPAGYAAAQHLERTTRP